MANSRARLSEEQIARLRAEVAKPSAKRVMTASKKLFELDISTREAGGVAKRLKQQNNPTEVQLTISVSRLTATMFKQTCRHYQRTYGEQLHAMCVAALPAIMAEYGHKDMTEDVLKASTTLAMEIMFMRISN